VFVCVVCLCVFRTAAQPSTCHGYTATGKVTMKILTKIADSHWSNIPSKDRQGNQQSPCHHGFSIAAGAQTRRLRSLGIGSFENRSACDRVPGRAHSPIPHLQLYRSAQHFHTSETVEPHRAPHGPRLALPSSLSSPTLLTLPLPPPFSSSASVHHPSA